MPLVNLGRLVPECVVYVGDEEEPRTKEIFTALLKPHCELFTPLLEEEKPYRITIEGVLHGAGRC